MRYGRARTATYRHRSLLYRDRLPENPHKTLKNRVICFEGGHFPVELCSGHRNSLADRWVRGVSSQVRLAGRGKRLRQGTILWKGTSNYGRLARSDEHPPGIAVPGSECGHALQVRGRADDSSLQAGEPLALQEVEAGSVDGREVEPDGSQEQQEETEGGRQGCRRVKAGTCWDSDRRRLLVWMWAPPASRRWN